MSCREERKRDVTQDGRFGWPENGFVDIFHKISLAITLAWILSNDVPFLQENIFLPGLLLFGCYCVLILLALFFGQTHRCKGEVVRQRGF